MRASSGGVERRRSWAQLSETVRRHSARFAKLVFCVLPQSCGTGEPDATHSLHPEALALPQDVPHQRQGALEVRGVRWLARRYGRIYARTPGSVNEFGPFRIQIRLRPRGGRALGAGPSKVTQLRSLSPRHVHDDVPEIDTRPSTFSGSSPWACPSRAHPPTCPGSGCCA